MPLISILMPVHDTPVGHFRLALDSIINQDIEVDLIEVLVVADRRRCEIDMLLLEYSQIPFVVLRTSRGSLTVGEARNLALAQATSPYALLLDSDDQLESSCANIMARLAKDHPGAGLYFANSTKYSHDLTRVIRVIDSGVYADLYALYESGPLNPIFHSVFVGHPILLHIASAASAGGFDPYKPCSELTDLVLRMHGAGHRIVHLPANLYRYRDSVGGLSKHRLVHTERKSSIAREFQALFGERVSVSDFGRLKPFDHMHYHLEPLESRTLIRLPYVDYRNLSIRVEEAVP